MQQSKVMFSIVALVLISASAFAFENHVRWNPMLEECVYFYAQGEDTTAHCFVDETECVKDGKDAYKDVDASTCYYIPRKEQGACETFVEGDLIVLDYKGSDPDENVGPAGKLVYTVGPPFDKDNRWQTARGDAGSYDVTVTVSDGEYQATESVCFTILSGNTPPVLAVKDVTADEGETVRLRPSCADEDGDALRITYAGEMTSDTWQTGYDDAGTYAVTVTCAEVGSDLKDTETVTVTIVDVDRAPTLRVDDVSVHEGETVRLSPACDDPEGTDVSIAYAGEMTTSTWQTGYDDAGTYAVTVTCTDATGKDAKDGITVTVRDKNRPPTITAVIRKA